MDTLEDQDNSMHSATSSDNRSMKSPTTSVWRCAMSGLTFPVYMTVRNSGDALVTIATTLDPSSADWQQASEIVCRILEERVGCGRLRGQELPCAIANAGVINAVDVTVD